MGNPVLIIRMAAALSRHASDILPVFKESVPEYPIHYGDLPGSVPHGRDINIKRYIKN
jgi:hypothetical protein